jgi:hypothetical protein
MLLDTRAPNTAAKAEPGNDARSADADMEMSAREVVKQRFDLAARAFIPRHYDGEMDLIVATQGRGATIDAARGWGGVARAVRVHKIDTTHKGLITEALPQVAERVRAWIGANGSTEA